MLNIYLLLHKFSKFQTIFPYEGTKFLLDFQEKNHKIWYYYAGKVLCTK